MSDPLASRTAIGVDIGGTSIRAARVSHDGRLSGLHRIPTDTAPDAAALVVDLCRGLLSDEVEAIGIGVPGRLDRGGTTVLSSGYVDLAGLRLAEVVETALGKPAVLENDAHMALIAEMRLGAARDVDDVVLFTAGTGIGGAVAAGGTVLRGRGNAGQLGHLALDPRGAVCNCGRRGCSEVLASGTALNHLIAGAGLPADTSAEWLLGHRNDLTASAILERWAGAWRELIDSLVAVLDPELVVIGGGLGRAAVEAVQAMHPETSPWFRCRVVPAQLGDDGGVVGAGLRALAGSGRQSLAPPDIRP